MAKPKQQYQMRDDHAGQHYIRVETIEPGPFKRVYIDGKEIWATDVSVKFPAGLNEVTFTVAVDDDHFEHQTVVEAP